MATQGNLFAPAPKGEPKKGSQALAPAIPAAQDRRLSKDINFCPDLGKSRNAQAQELAPAIPAEFAFSAREAWASKQTKQEYSSWIRRAIKVLGFLAGVDFSITLIDKSGLGRPFRDHLFSASAYSRLLLYSTGAQGKEHAKRVFETLERAAGAAAMAKIDERSSLRAESKAAYKNKTAAFHAHGIRRPVDFARLHQNDKFQSGQVVEAKRDTMDVGELALAVLTDLACASKVNRSQAEGFSEVRQVSGSAAGEVAEAWRRLVGPTPRELEAAAQLDEVLALSTSADAT